MKRIHSLGMDMPRLFDHSDRIPIVVLPSILNYSKYIKNIATFSLPNTIFPANPGQLSSLI